MSSTGPEEVSLESFRMLAELAGLGMTEQELEELKPIYDLHYEYIKKLHSINLGAEEMVVFFEPDWRT